jgi:hypothetical protein
LFVWRSLRAFYQYCSSKRRGAAFKQSLKMKFRNTKL